LVEEDLSINESKSWILDVYGNVGVFVYTYLPHVGDVSPGERASTRLAGAGGGDEVDVVCAPGVVAGEDRLEGHDAIGVRLLDAAVMRSTLSHRVR
jgi:hypothetical protein